MFHWPAFALAGFVVQGDSGLEDAPGEEGVKAPQLPR